MKKTIKTMLAFVAGAVLLAGCAKEEIEKVNGPELVTLTAYQEGDDATKAAIDGTDNTKINWTANDAIKVFGTSASAQYTTTAGGSTSASFTGTEVAGAAYALYPYQENATNNAGVITAEVPMTQYAVANSFDPKAALMVGVVNGTSVKFKNVMSYVKVTIPGNMYSCKQVSLKAKAAWTTVAGKVDITVADAPTWAETSTKEGQAFVRLVPTSPATTLTAGATYYIAILPQTMATGFELIFNDNDVIKVKQASSSVTFSRSTTKKLADITSFTYSVSTIDLSKPDGASYSSLKMADRNIGVGGTGTTVPTGTDAYGDYFAWAALRPAYMNKTTPTWYWSGGFTAANTPYYSGSSYTKYKNEGDNLEAADDIAAMLWGGNWRIATYAEWDANKTNDSVIGLPLAGGCGGTNISTATTNGFYWSTTHPDDVERARLLRTIGSAVYVTATEYRYSGLPVRPVLATPAPTNLSASATANCYIVSGAGTYKIKTVKGNSAESVGTVASADVLWASFGTDTAPAVGALVSGVGYADDYITFTATNNKGNALIAARDAGGNILWSWHIWLTDKPEDQVYNNSAGTMMDRNLGATSATPGDVQALGLLYQWGRKDPFLSGDGISSSTKAASTGSWPSAERISGHLSGNNTQAFATANPMTFLKNESSPNDWYCTSSSYKNDQLWSDTKTIYDPCPAGYRVPDGASSGVWCKAFGTSVTWTNTKNWDDYNKGMNFGATDNKLGSASTIWYPTAGYLKFDTGSLSEVGSYGTYWSCTPSSNYASSMYFNYMGFHKPSYEQDERALAQSVRCLKESK